MADKNHAPDDIWAELVYLPHRIRSANVAIRPSVQEYEIVVGANPGVDFARVISLEELMVGIDHGRLYLRRGTDGRKVKISTNHLLNNRRAPPICRLLAEISMDGQPYLDSFDWGPATDFPFLPRIQSRRIVLRPAQWRIDSILGASKLASGEPQNWQKQLAGWRTLWDVPQYVYLANHDQRLLLNLEDEKQNDILRMEVKRLGSNSYIILQEMLPNFDGLWLERGNERFVAEFIVPLSLRISHGSEPKENKPPSPIATTDNFALKNISQDDRFRPPGSDWLFVKLYCGNLLEEDLLVPHIQDFVGNVIGSGLAENWFFIRYADPQPHLRLRFRGRSRILEEQLLPEVCKWASQLMKQQVCLRFSFDTYEREIERYGGLEGTKLSEELFGADSFAVLELIRLQNKKKLDLDRTSLIVLTINDLLAALSLEQSERLRWCASVIVSRHVMGQKYRHRIPLLRDLLGNPDCLRTISGGDELSRILEVRRNAFEMIYKEISKTFVKNESGLPYEIIGSYVHMHFNRFFGTNSGKERETLDLLFRTLTSLNKYPVQQSDG